MDNEEIKRVIEKQLQLLSNYSFERTQTLCASELAELSREMSHIAQILWDKNDKPKV